MRRPLFTLGLVCLLSAAKAQGEGQAAPDATPPESASPRATAKEPFNYPARIRISVLRNIAFSEKFDRLYPPRAEVEVLTGERGLITEVRVVKPSTMPTWDAAVVRALWKTERIPLDQDGRAPSKLLLIFTPA